MNSFLIPTFYLFVNIVFVPNTYAHKKGSLGVPRTLWVLTPSLCVTNPLTCNLWHFISFDLKTSYLWVLFVLFPFPLETIKARWRLLLFDLQLIHSLMIMNLPLQKLSGDSVGEQSPVGLAYFLCVYICIFDICIFVCMI